MITIEERKCTPEELEEKQKYVELFRNGSAFHEMEPLILILLLSLAAFCSIFFLPLIVVIAQHFNFLGNAIFLILLGIFFITLLSIPLIWIYKRRLDKERNKYINRHLKDLSDPKIEIKTINNIEEVWEFYEVELNDPGFLFRTKENEYFTFLTQDLLDYWPDVDEEDTDYDIAIIPEEVVFEKWIASGITHKFHLNGKGISRSGYVTLEHFIDLKNDKAIAEFFSEELNQFPDEIQNIIDKHVVQDLESFDE